MNRRRSRTDEVGRDYHVYCHRVRACCTRACFIYRSMVRRLTYIICGSIIINNTQADPDGHDYLWALSAQLEQGTRGLLHLGGRSLACSWVKLGLCSHLCSGLWLIRTLPRVLRYFYCMEARSYPRARRRVSRFNVNRYDNDEVRAQKFIYFT